MTTGFRRIVFASIIAVLAALPARAQSAAATLQGTVTDGTGAAVPNAQIRITAQLTGVSRDVVTNGDGFYSAPNLNAASYSVTTSAPGFGKNVLKDVVLTVGVVRDLDISVAVAAAEMTVTIESSANQVNLGETSVQGVVDGKQTRDLPLNGRDWTTLATLNSGVSQILTQFAGAATATTRLSRGLGAQLTIGGNRPQQNSYRLDGVNINDYANGGPGSVSGATLGVDAVQEFSVVTSDAPAQYGRMSGGVINSITRTGTNVVHGSVYDFLRNSAFDSRGFFDPVGGGEPSFRRNQFGATIGGPVIKDKTFFFANYEGFRQAQGVSIQSTVLSPNARTGLVTCTGNGKAPCNLPGTITPAPTGTAGLQQLAVNAAVPPYLALFPTPNGTINGNTGQFNFNTTQVSNEDFSTIHLDHNFSQRDSLHGTLLYDTAALDSADGTNTLYDEAISRRTTASVEEVHIFTSRLANSFRLGYNRSVAIAPNLKSVLNPAVNNPALSYYTGRNVGQLIISGLTTVQGGSGSVGTNAFHYNAYQLYDDASYVIGHHSFTFGGTIEYDQNNTLGGVLPNGQWNFGSINNFLTNVPSFFEGGTPATPVVPHDLRQTIYAAYVQDSWKLRSNLTVNLGLRYEMATNTTESRGRLGSLATPTSATAQSEPSFFTNNPTSKNFEPRVGISWDPYKNGKTVFSAASGIYDILPLNYFLQLQIISSAPTYQEGRVTYSGTTGSGLFPITPFYTTTPLLRQIYTPRTPPRSYVIQSNVNIQQQLTNNTVLQIGYITSHGVHQVFTTNDINNVPYLGQDPNGNYYWPDLKVTGAARSALILNPAVGTESNTIFAGSSIYNSLQASLSYSAPKGITGKVAYTWSHSIDDSSSAVSGASFGNSVSGLPSFDLRLDRANSDFDLRNVFSANAVAPLPDIKRGGVYTSILRHWTFNNIISARTGIPFTPIIGGDPLGLLGSQPFAFPDRVVQNRKCTNGHNVNYVDTTCFAFPTTYNYATGLNGPRLGTSRRNTLDGPGFFYWTTGLMRDQPITERLRAQIQVQAFNASNHTNFSNPASAQTQIYNVSGALSSTAGLITSSATQGRQLQFALKLIY
ncbi:MAG: TonB-dependent receptor [Acidobacteriota bacterium]|nr:TonB-dependent receptor [Acidobacteriota bacterium]